MKRLSLLLFLVIASGIACSDRSVIAPEPAPGSRFVFSDIDWIRGQYFLLYDPSSGAPLDVEHRDIRVYRDDANAANDYEVIPARAVLDPDGTLGQPLTPAQAAASVTGLFNILTAGADYEILDDFFAFHDTTYHVIRLTRPISRFSNEVLAVSFKAAPIVGPGHALGPPISVGGRILISPGPDPDSLLLKLLSVPARLELLTPDGTAYDPTSPWAPAHELELKNIYSLGGINIDPASFTLTLQQGQGIPPVTGQGSVSFIEMFGLDSWNEGPTITGPGQDGRIDSIGYTAQTPGWIDYTNGLLRLPDFRPFAPRLDGPSAAAFDLYLAAHVSRRLRLGQPGGPSPSSPDPYALYAPRIVNAAWFFTVSHGPSAMPGANAR
jgi:hypothetical protein